MLEPFETVQILVLALLGLVPLVVAFAVLRMLSRIGRAIERIANTLEERSPAHFRSQ